MNTQISDYQKDCFTKYKKEIGYPLDYRYLSGAPINVLVPIETPVNNIMIIGAYPSAKFHTIDGITDVPVADNDSPFSNESYFDGSRVRTIPSGKELNEVILKKIGVERSDCWITDLVKVFLFKEGHVERYIKLGIKDIKENRSKFEEYAKKSLPWIEQEIAICNPKVIILLGMEVTKVFFEVAGEEAKSYLNGEPRKKIIKDVIRNILCLPHPGILMKLGMNNHWPERFENEISINAKGFICDIQQERIH
jgi:uracil-DNA glycosylase